MSFKTLLRKWHTWVGLLILCPSVCLSLTGIYLIESTEPKESLIAGTSCNDGPWIAVSSEGIVGDALSVSSAPFALSSVAAISCTQTHIDMALDYGPIASTPRNQLRWSMIPRPFDGPIRTLKRTANQLTVGTQTGLWTFNGKEWASIIEYEPTLAQAIYSLHAGWLNGQSFTWVWTLTGVMWCVLSFSGVWIFLRMIKKPLQKQD